MRESLRTISLSIIIYNNTINIQRYRGLQNRIIFYIIRTVNTETGKTECVGDTEDIDKYKNIKEYEEGINMTRKINKRERKKGKEIKIKYANYSKDEARSIACCACTNT
ncbi:hypothetical protein PUN28_019930 [Cardiocondyla obscurior]|uniref:Uncharacterized protein n=1 Tax=Cardiocondyla obscurior TaxID=286306 RepID=A0AAW2EAX5_9HYME